MCDEGDGRRGALDGGPRDVISHKALAPSVSSSPENPTCVMVLSRTRHTSSFCPQETPSPKEDSTDYRLVRFRRLASELPGSRSDVFAPSLKA